MKAIERQSGMIVDVVNARIYSGTVVIEDGRISRIEEDNKSYGHFVLPGFVDAHIHIESSMLTPYEFARIALTHGTVATVSDPHEIANVCGMEGVLYMLENARAAGLKFHFGAPSCVPATSFETAGAVLNADDVNTLLKRNDIFYLSEMMNYPGVLFNDAEVMQKIAYAKANNKPVDGHAPGLRGEDAEKYIKAGISTDHECFTIEEALDKLKFGMKILIREGSAARNFEALIPLLPQHYKNIMFCCDDKHPDELLLGHINEHVKRAIAKGNDVMKVLQCACVNPVKHYKMNVGLLQKGDTADFIVVDNLKDFNVQRTVINGTILAEEHKSFLPNKVHPLLNNFNTSKKNVADFAIHSTAKKMKVIEALEGQLITRTLIADCKKVGDEVISDPVNDILKITVVNRYNESKPAIAFINNFGLKDGAIASSVAHDSHNIIAVGTSDELICKAVNLLIENTGGLSAVTKSATKTVALPIAGLISDKDAVTIGKAYAEVDKMAKDMGSTLRAPYMTLSFMALLVIPQLKLSDKGLFDGGSFSFTDLFESHSASESPEKGRF